MKAIKNQGRSHLSGSCRNLSDINLTIVILFRLLFLLRLVFLSTSVRKLPWQNLIFLKNCKFQFRRTRNPQYGSMT